MSNPLETPLPRSDAVRRWLWTVRILVVGSIVFIVLLIFAGLAGELSSAPESPWGALLLGALLLALPPALPYLWILVRLGGKARQKGLALSVVIGAWAFLSGVLILGIQTTEPCRIGPLNPLLFPIGGLFASLQIVLVCGAINTSYVLQRVTGGKFMLGREILKRALYVGLPLLLVNLIAVPNLLRSRSAAGQASPVGNLRTINTAEITYASTYNAGYSANLASLAPPASGVQPSLTAAGLIDSVLAGGVKNAYRFEYKPGPAENGRIDSYTVTARPIKYATCGYNSYFTDESGVIRSTGEDRPATAEDLPLAG